MIAAVVFVALCVVGLCFNILFRKNGKFPETEISRNPEMRRRGIRCVNEEEMIRMRKEADERASGAESADSGDGQASVSCGEFECGNCEGCGLFRRDDVKSK